jgi:hypothetical protein
MSFSVPSFTVLAAIVPLAYDSFFAIWSLMSLTVWRSRGQISCRMSLNLNLMFFSDQTGFELENSQDNLERISQRWNVFLISSHQGVHDILGDVTFYDLVKLVFPRFFHWKVRLFVSHTYYLESSLAIQPPDKRKEGLDSTCWREIHQLILFGIFLSIRRIFSYTYLYLIIHLYQVSMDSSIFILYPVL